MLSAQWMMCLESEYARKIQAPDCASIPMPFFLDQPRTASKNTRDSYLCRMSQCGVEQDGSFQMLLQEVAFILLGSTTDKSASTAYISRNLSEASRQLLLSEGLRLGAVLRRFKEDFVVVSRGKACSVCYLPRAIKARYYARETTSLISL
eukprot:TRINITY_DN96578_c0_g1_i1.p1 TRINITY_DN96578_c0_g1~~TRINITY_DN96578_c0_g1_i1.p1  ORF type:complete len:150 (+),score=23.46 TRINITY_DN96578_c0_g1_i1:138-587(+)